MRVQIKDLKPNPFRDMKNYPINPEKIENLTNSINQTGFWDNILARKNNGKIEIAYGHHRLVVLKKLKKPDDYVNIPIKELDDTNMIRIMANENMNEWDTNTMIIDETIRVTKKYLLSHEEIVESIYRILKIGRYRTKYGISSRVISEFLGSGLWYRERITKSLSRLKLEDEGELSKKAVGLLPHEYASEGFTERVKKMGDVTLEQQEQAAEKIVEGKRFDDLTIRDILVDETLGDKKKEPTEEEEKLRTFGHLIEELARDTKKLHNKYLELLEVNRELKPEFKKCKNSLAARELSTNSYLLVDIIMTVWGEVKNNETGKNKVSRITG